MYRYKSDIEVANKIKKYYDNTIVFLPRLTYQNGLATFPVEKQMAFDIHNESEFKSKGITIPIKNIQQWINVVSILANDSDTKNFEEDLNKFISKNSVDASKPLFITAFFV